uniref:Uncharacterized protein TCIL3000_1_450 n=1 Tax=Trypanosoma congolense (strain IL3000) TaxID=1068625 RepID=G0UIT7_TRYCI|nr:unnamed protein product [Trypanosoma congolense IL3000]
MSAHVCIGNEVDEKRSINDWVLRRTLFVAKVPNDREKKLSFLLFHSFTERSLVSIHLLHCFVFCYFRFHFIFHVCLRVIGRIYESLSTSGRLYDPLTGVLLSGYFSFTIIITIISTVMLIFRFSWLVTHDTYIIKRPGTPVVGDRATKLLRE